MLESNLQHKPTSLSPFHPLPAIGQKLERSKTKVIVFDLNKDEEPVEIHNVLEPLTPLRIRGFTRKSSLDLKESRKPQQLIRENTYDVLEPLYLHKEEDNGKTETSEKTMDTETKVSPKTRFKKAAMQVAKLSTMPETGKLLCMRERQTFNVCVEGDKTCRLEQLPRTPTQQLNKLTEIFQSLEMKGHQRDRMKKENSWF